MMQEKNYAQFWKCALQVNPSSYSATYRGKDNGLTEDAYNTQILEKCLELDIKVVGIADHGNVARIAGIKKILEPQGIIVFPGFEIASNDKIHFVCLFDEKTTEDSLNRYLGKLELIDTLDGVSPSKLSAEELIKKVDELGGFIYAAHCTLENGLLKQRLNHVWKLPELRAAQIPGTVEDLKGVEGDFYRLVFLNKNPEYKRDLPIASINAKDIEKPDDLENDGATCLIKMTKPCFESFKKAFQDSESRVRLNSDVSEKYYSCIKSIKVTGGYLDGVEIEFSDHLNAVIGGRGTGKSTLLECIRYALDKKPIGENAKKQHDAIIKENLGKSKARVELVIKSSKMNGKLFTIARRFGENISVMDANNIPSSFIPMDLLPTIEIYGQNEIYDIAQNAHNHGELLSRFLSINLPELEKNIQDSLDKLSENRKKIIDTQEKIGVIEDEVAKLPKLEERAIIFTHLGLEDKLKIVPFLEVEKQLLSRSAIEAQNLDTAFKNIQDSLPDTIFLSETAIEKLPHAEFFRKIKNQLDLLHKDAETLLVQWQGFHTKANGVFETVSKDVIAGIQTEEKKLESIFKELPSSEGKSGKQIGIEYQDLLKEIERIRPKKTSIETHKALLDALLKQRKSILNELSQLRSKRVAQYEKSIKALNKKLVEKVQLIIEPEADRYSVIQFLLNCNLEGIGESRLAWIKIADDFSPIKLAQLIQEGILSLRSSNWGITDNMANALIRLSEDQRHRLEELDLPDKISIELNTAHEGENHFKQLDDLSAGQKCTALLHLLLLQNQDPLLMDQPEDNLDNAFIADRIVSELRSAKIERQFIFTTHNANIPIFGDAEWIGVFETEDNQAQMPKDAQGGVDSQNIRAKSALILEGGKAAFMQRREKYGF